MRVGVGFQKVILAAVAAQFQLGTEAVGGTGLASERAGLQDPLDVAGKVQRPLVQVARGDGDDGRRGVVVQEGCCCRCCRSCCTSRIRDGGWLGDLGFGRCDLLGHDAYLLLLDERQGLSANTSKQASKHRERGYLAFKHQTQDCKMCWTPLRWTTMKNEGI